MQDGGGILIVSTRWHLDDLCGRLLEREPERWRVVPFPAIATADEEHRKQGEALTEERYSLEALTELRGSMDEYLWNALFQQNPTPEGGRMLKRHRWRYWQPPGPQLRPVTVLNERGEVIEVAAEELPAGFSRHIQTWDLAFEGKSTSDFVAGLDIRVNGREAPYCRFHREDCGDRTVSRIASQRERHIRGEPGQRCGCDRHAGAEGPHINLRYLRRDEVLV